MRFMSLYDPLSNIRHFEAQVPSWLHSWLTEDVFLTKKLKKLTGDASLNYLGSVWSRPDWWEQHVLALSCEQVYRREITMHSHSFACWYAKTIIPAVTYYAFSNMFQRLEHQSLGDILFSEPKIKRVSSDFYPVEMQCLEYHWPSAELVNHYPVLWLKLSRFLIKDHFEFYLAELFLPGFEQCLKRCGEVTGN